MQKWVCLVLPAEESNNGLEQAQKRSPISFNCLNKLNEWFVATVGKWLACCVLSFLAFPSFNYTCFLTQRTGALSQLPTVACLSDSFKKKKRQKFHFLNEKLNWNEPPPFGFVIENKHGHLTTLQMRSQCWPAFGETCRNNTSREPGVDTHLSENENIYWIQLSELDFL